MGKKFWIVLFGVFLLLSISLINSDDIKAIGKDSKVTETIHSRGANYDVIDKGDGNFKKISYFGQVNVPEGRRGEFIPFEDYLNVSDEHGKIKLEVDGKVCYLQLDYNLKSQLTQASPSIDITKNRGNYYFTTNIGKEVDSMKYFVNCSDWDLEFTEEKLSLDKINIDFKMAREKQNISTEYNPETKLLEFKPEIDSKTGQPKSADLSFIDPVVEYNFNSTYEGINIWAYAGESDEINYNLCDSTYSSAPNNLTAVCKSGSATWDNMEEITSSSKLDFEDGNGFYLGMYYYPNNNINYIKANFSIPETPLNMTLKTRVLEGNDWSFYGNGDVNTYIWNYTSNLWVSLFINSDVSWENYNKSIINSTSNIGDFLNNGVVEFLIWVVNRDETDTGHMDVDYISLEITYNPTVNIEYPTNNYIFTQDAPTAYINVSTDSPVDACRWTPDSGLTNYSMTQFNTTWFTYSNTSMVDGDYSYEVWCNDSSNGNWVSSETYSFQVDSIYPSISIVYPTNLTNTTNTQLNINYTRSDANLDSCWYSRNKGTTNTTLTGCVNITGITWYEGLNNITIWANDSANHLNSSSVTFRVDTTPPTSTASATSPPDGASYTFGNWATDDVKVTITAYDSGVGFDNLAYPLYCTDTSNTCQPDTYIGSGVTISTVGTTYIRYYSNDTLDNNETIKSGEIKIRPTISLDVITPSDLNSVFNAEQNAFFNVTVNVTCNNYDCGEINVSLDPELGGKEIKEIGKVPDISKKREDKENSIYTDSKDYYDVYLKNNSMNTLFLDGEAYIKVSYGSENKNLVKDGDKYKSVISDKEEVNFYKIEKENIQDTNNIRYINLSQVNSTEMATNYPMFEYSEYSVPTIISYIPSEGYVFYGRGNYFRDLKEETKYTTIRYKTEKDSDCPVIVSDGNAIVIEFHKSIVTDEDVDIFYSAIERAVNDYGITKIKKSDFFLAKSLIYYKDGIDIRQIGRLAKNGDSIIFFMYLESPDERMFDSLTELTKIKQKLITSTGGLKDLNSEIDFSIKDKIVSYFLEEKGYSYYISDFTPEENDIKFLLSKEITKEDWLINGKWESPFIEKEEDAYEYLLTLNEKPQSNIISIDIKTEGLEFYYQPELNEADRLNGDFRPSNIEKSYAVYYDNNRRDYEYKTGKVMNIYRPKVIDSEYNWRWAEININEQIGKIIITISQDFLDSAVYPVKVDPTFGYTSIGGSSQYVHNYGGTNNSIVGLVVSGKSGMVSKIAGYTSISGDKYSCAIFNFGLYNYATSEFVAGSNTSINGIPSFVNNGNWSNLSLSGSIPLYNQEYVIVTSGYNYTGDLGSCDNLNAYYSIYYDEITSNIGRVNSSVPFTKEYPSEVFFNIVNNRSYSMFVTYEDSITKGLINTTIGATPFYTNQSNPRNITLTADTSQLVTFWVNATGSTLYTNYTFFAYANDTVYNESNISSTWMTQIVDLTSPTISIVSPNNLTNSSDTSLDINFTYSDLNVDSCWYSNDTYSVNTTLSGCSNLTTITWANGQHNVTIWVNDSGNNQAFDQVTFLIDSVNPNITLIIPVNNSFNSTDQNFTGNITDNLGLKNATLFIYNSTNDLVNETTTNFIEGFTEKVVGTVVSLVEGVYSWFYKAFDWAGNVFTSGNNTLTIDTTNPSVSIIYPVDYFNTTDTGLNVNFTVSDTYLDSCWWTNNGGSSTISCENITTETWSEGSHNITVYANDSANNINQDSINFTIDTTPPSVSIVAPLDYESFTTGTIDLNYTVSDSGVGLDTCLYQNNTDSNQTIVCGTNTTISQGSDGTYTVTVCANDTLNNLACDSKTWSVSTDAPAVTLQKPDNQKFLNSQIVTFNYTAVDGNGIDTCYLYGNWTGSWSINLTNYHLVDTSVDINEGNFTQTINDGLYKWNVWCNDSSTPNKDSFATLNRTFTVDTTYPLISYGINNDTNSTNTFIYLNVSVTELNEDSITFNLFNSTNGLINSTKYTNKKRNITWSNLTDGLYYFNVTINDSANNKNSTPTYLTRLDDTKPIISIVIPDAINYGTNNSMELNYTTSDNFIGLDECWYYIQNSTGSTIVSSTTLSNCENDTFTLPGGDIDYTLYLFAKDILGNTQTDSVTFGIRTVSPVVVLYPSNDTQVNNGSSLYFNFTVETNADSITNCSLYGNWSSWHLNQTINSPSESVNINFSEIDLNEGDYFWNVLCYDNFGYSNWALNNQSFSVDLTNPETNITSITTTTGSQTFTFDSTATDLHSLTCKYSIFDSTNSIDRLNENVSFTCNSLDTSATVSAYGTYNLTIYATDKSGNENNSVKSFTTQASSGSSPGGGGGGSPPLLPVIAIIQPSQYERLLNDIERAIIYARILDSCKNYSTVIHCSLLIDRKNELIEIFKNKGINMDLNELGYFLEYFEDNEIEEVQVARSDATYNGLVISSLLVTGKSFQISPARLDPLWFIINEDTFKTTITSNKKLASCEVIDNPNLKCTIKDSYAELEYTLPIFPPEFNAEILKAKVTYTSEDGEIYTQDVQIRAFSKIFLIIFGFVIFLGISVYYLYSKGKLKIRLKI